MATGYGRISSINRISYYKGTSARSSRTYRGVKTGRMVADISSRLQKAQDTQMKDQFDNGNLSADQYNAYLTQRIAQTSDSAYREQLTQELQNVVTGTNESNMLDGYKAGTVSAAEVASYYQSKLQSLTPDNPLYSKTQADIVKWNNTATTDSYKAQEAVLKSQETGAADQLPAAQKLLDFYVQYLQKLAPNSPEYNTTVQAIGTYQKKVRDLTFQQSLLKAEDQISQTYNKNTPEDWAAKAQMYQQLRDAAAQEGDTTNFYKYDELANNATDAANKAQTEANAKQISQAISKVRESYISGQIDGNTAQQQLQEIGLYADQNGDVSGSLLVHDLYNTIQSDIDHGVVYGGDNGYGKIKGGSGGDSGWYDLSAGTPISAGFAKTINSLASGNGTPGTTTSAINKSASASSSSNNGSSNLLSQIMTAAKVSNPTPEIAAELNNAYQSGATFNDMVNLLRVKKIGTGDGYKALEDIQDSTAKTLNNALHLGYDPTTGIPFTPDQYRQALIANNTVLAQQYGAWQSYIDANPKAKIQLNGKSVAVSTLADNIDKTLNGTTKIDPETGLEVKDTPGLLDSIATLQSPNSDFTVVEDPKNPGQFIATSKANFEAQNGTLASKYIQDENGVWHLINNPTPKEVTFSTEKEATAYAKSHGIDPSGIGISKGQFIVYVPTGQRNVTVYGPNGQKIMYILNPDNTISKVQSTKGALPAGFAPNKIMSFGGAQISVPTSAKSGFDQTLTPATKKTPANFSTQYGPRYASLPKTEPYSPIPSNTSTKSGPMYNPPPAQNGLNYSPVPAKASAGPLFTPVTSVSNKIIGPGGSVFQNPLDVLISKVIPAMKPVQPIEVPTGTPLDLSQPQQQQFRSIAPSQQAQSSLPQNPASPSAPLQVVGQQQQTPLQRSGIKVNLGSFPSANQQPAPTQNSWISNAESVVTKTAGNLWNGATSALGNIFGGFHF